MRGASILGNGLCTSRVLSRFGAVVFAEVYPGHQPWVQKVGLSGRAAATDATFCAKPVMGERSNFIGDGGIFYFLFAVNVPSPNSVESLPFIESLFSIVPVYFSTSGVPWISPVIVKSMV